MSETRAVAPSAGAAKAWPAIRPIGVVDVIEALGAGLRDLRAAPRFGLVFGLIYATGGWLLLALLWAFKLPYLAYPMAMGFALIAPFVVVGLYDVSRRLETGEPLSFGAVFGSIRGSSRRDLRWMALITAFSLVIWMDIAALLFFGFLGFKPLNADLLSEMLTTPSGLLFLFIGHAAGAMIAFFIFSISVLSFPMLYERDVDFVTAMVTSVKAVIANPVPMALWCAIITVLVLLSIASGFVGLIVALPILGHASWHLYRHIVPAEGAAG